MKISAINLLLLITVIPASAAVTMPAIFADHMVLQQGKTLPIWGWAAAGEKVTVSIGGHAGSVVAGEDRFWRIDLPVMTASEEPLVLSVSGTNTLKFHDVLIGDVWLCSGQSNMRLSMEKCHTGRADIPKATDAGMRLYVVDEQTALTPVTDHRGRWVVCSPDVVKDFSAVGYYFGREIREVRRQPIGLIGSYWGGTFAQAWTSREALAANPPFRKYLDMIDREISGGGASKEGKPERRSESKPAEPKHVPSAIFNAMIHPLIPYALTGVIWYQGEHNAGSPIEYRTLFPRLIVDWRSRWGQGDLPFLFVQLSTWKEAQSQPVEGIIPWQRDSQMQALALPRTGMAVAIDINAGPDIHPPDKLDVGKRLALTARRVAYGEDVVHQGPTYRSLVIEGNALRLTFDHSQGLKVAAPPWLGEKATRPPANEPSPFAIAGADGHWRWAKATIEGESIVLISDQVKAPVAAAYAWAANPACNVYNGSNLPMVPFCTNTQLLPEKPKQ